MIKTVIEYDPFYGCKFSDGELLEKALELYNLSDHILVCQETMIQAYRVLVKRCKIDHNSIVFRFKGRDLSVNKDGWLEEFPKGFCDTMENLMLELI